MIKVGYVRINKICSELYREFENIIGCLNEKVVIHFLYNQKCINAKSLVITILFPNAPLM